MTWLQPLVPGFRLHITSPILLNFYSLLSTQLNNFFHSRLWSVPQGNYPIPLLWAVLSQNISHSLIRQHSFWVLHASTFLQLPNSTHIWSLRTIPYHSTRCSPSSSMSSVFCLFSAQAWVTRSSSSTRLHMIGKRFCNPSTSSEV